jgi:hypothetical protein
MENTQRGQEPILYPHSGSSNIRIQSVDRWKKSVNLKSGYLYLSVRIIYEIYVKKTLVNILNPLPKNPTQKSINKIKMW